MNTAYQARLDTVIRQLHVGGDPHVKDDCTIKTSPASQATVIDTTAYPVASQDGKQIKVTVDGGAEQTIALVGALTTAAHMIAAINSQAKGFYAFADGAQVRFRTESWGHWSSISVDVDTSDLTFATASDEGAGGLKRGSVMVMDPATSIWEPLTNVALTTGLEVPRGVFEGYDIDPHKLAAGNVTNQNIAIGGPVRYDSSQLVLHNSVALTDEITNQNMTVEHALASIGIFAEAVNFVSQLENS